MQDTYLKVSILDAVLLTTLELRKLVEPTEESREVLNKYDSIIIELFNNLVNEINNLENMKTVLDNFIIDELQEDEFFMDAMATHLSGTLSFLKDCLKEGMPLNNFDHLDYLVNSLMLKIMTIRNNQLRSPDYFTHILKKKYGIQNSLIGGRDTWEKFSSEFIKDAKEFLSDNELINYLENSLEEIGGVLNFGSVIVEEEIIKLGKTTYSVKVFKLDIEK